MSHNQVQLPEEWGEESHHPVEKSLPKWSLAEKEVTNW